MNFRIFRNASALIIIFIILFIGPAVPAETSSEEAVNRLLRLMNPASVGLPEETCGGTHAGDLPTQASPLTMQTELAAVKPPEGGTVRSRALTSPIYIQIWSSIFSVSMPDNSYLYSQNDALMTYMCPSQNMLIGAGRTTAASLSHWQSALDQQGCATGLQNINGISTVFGIYHDSDGYDVSFYFTEGTYSYALLVINTSYEQASFFINDITSTLVYATLQYCIWDSDAVITFPGNAFQYAGAAETIDWYCPSEGILVSFSRYPRTSLAAWYLAVTNSGESPSFTEINGTPALLAMTEVAEEEYRLSCIFNYENYSYGVVAAGLTYDQLETMHSDILWTLSVPKEYIPEPPIVSEFPLSMPDNLSKVGEQAFAGALADSIILNDGCTSIGPKAFADCSRLQFIFIPESVTSIAADAFEGSCQVVIYSPDCTFAAAYAAFYGIPWVQTP